VLKKTNFSLGELIYKLRQCGESLKLWINLMLKEGENLVIIGGGITGLSTALSWAINVDIKHNPVKGLFQPKFSHGVWPSLQGGMQVVDMILRGKIMRGNSRYQARNFL
jgi:hypothetical protein